MLCLSGFELYARWVPLTTTTFGPWKFGRIDGVVVNYGAKCFETTFYYIYTFNPP